MPDPAYLTTPQGRNIAFHLTPGASPTIVFLGGFRSDMDGTKALYLEAWAKAQGRAFLRLDYSGHGASSGDFLDGCIGDWTTDAYHAIVQQVPGNIVLVGSSMGGWIALLLARRLADRIVGMIGIAAAPDFTEDDMRCNFTPKQQAELADKGQIALPSDYSDEPYIITRRLIEDGRDQLVLRTPLVLPWPTRFLQGTADTDVDISVALRLLNHASGPDIRLTLVKGADHRFSTPAALDLIVSSVADVLDHML